jgi:hypothetical protein
MKNTIGLTLVVGHILVPHAAPAEQLLYIPIWQLELRCTHKER